MSKILKVRHLLFRNSIALQKHFRFFFILILLTIGINFCGSSQSTYSVQQLNVANIFSWPHQPKPYKIFDWKKRALDFDDFIFDWNKKSEFPTIRWDTTHYNMLSNTIFIPAYYGDGRFSHDGWQDGLNIIADIIGSTLCGRRKDSVIINDSVYDYVNMLRTFKHHYKKRKTVYDWPEPEFIRNQTDWWYDIGPSVLYFMIGHLYPDEPAINNDLKDIAVGVYDMIEHLGGENVDFWHQAYNFDTNKPVDSAVFDGKVMKWKCPEAGVPSALIEYWAYKKFGDKKFLNAAKWCMNYYERLDKNPYYEMGISFGPYIAALMNAELGTNYHPEKFIKWLIKGSDVRAGYGTSEKNWNGYDTYGLVGSRKDRGEGYVFGLETFANAFLAPAVKYDTRLAKTVAIWLLNAGNASRFFYADQMPASNQFYGLKYKLARENVIPYEGLKFSEDGESPRATGDPVKYNAIWASLGKAFDVGANCTDLAIYDGAWSGFFGAILNNTNVSRILQVDLNKLDFFKSDSSYPTYLYYNPYKTDTTVEISLKKSSDLFNALTGKFIARNVSGNHSFTISKGNVMVLIVAPANSKIVYKNRKMFIHNRVVSYEPK